MAEVKNGVLDQQNEVNLTFPPSYIAVMLVGVRLMGGKRLILAFGLTWGMGRAIREAAVMVGVRVRQCQGCACEL